ncbi:GNAT family N-acetyltransferase [Hoeflea sp.]|uniref:GNAT family N-acetyltransferase n=1 Tax=Hoeflea sp. TaxID=1940281 RepID=UPI003A90F5C5
MKIGRTILTERQRIRGWEDTDTDRAFFHRVNSDDQIQRYFPWRWSRAEADENFDRMQARTAENGFGWAVAEDLETGTPIGFVGLGWMRHTQTTGPGVEIGWRYVPEAWGKGLATEAARALLVHGFEDLGLKRIVAYAVVSNRPSLAVMARIGMRERPDLSFDHPMVPDDMPHLKRHALWEKLAPSPRN